VARERGERVVSPEAHTELDPALSSARRARDFVRRMLEVWEVDDPDEVAVLLTSEVVSNAVLHAATRLGLDIGLDDDVLRVEVHDRAARRPVVRPPDTSAVGGRGLRLVEELARRWGTEAEGDGKVVWFEVSAPPRRSDDAASAGA
jgi:anti-sigma regulatory factor (Ser/Thr protein kinase)